MWCCRAVLRAGGGLTGAGEALMENLVVCGFGGWWLPIVIKIQGEPCPRKCQVSLHLTRRRCFPRGPAARLPGVPGVLRRPVLRHRRHRGGGAQCQCF